MEKMINILDIAELPEQEMMSILRQGSVLRLPYLEQRLRHAQGRIRHFEAKHATTLQQLLDKGLPDDAGYQLHEDFIEWEHWADIAQETQAVIDNVRRILSRTEEASDLG